MRTICTSVLVLCFPVQPPKMKMLSSTGVAEWPYLCSSGLAGMTGTSHEEPCRPQPRHVRPVKAVVVPSFAGERGRVRGAYLDVEDKDRLCATALVLLLALEPPEAPAPEEHHELGSQARETMAVARGGESVALDAGLGPRHGLRVQLPQVVVVLPRASAMM